MIYFMQNGAGWLNQPAFLFYPPELLGFLKKAKNENIMRIAGKLCHDNDAVDCLQ